MKSQSHRSIRMLCEGALMVVLAQVLGYLKLWQMPWGGTICLVMLPIFLFSCRWGLGAGIMSGLVLGILQFVFDGGIALGWQSIIGDYLLAFTVLGLGGIFRNRIQNRGAALACGSLAALGARYLCHIASGYILFSGYAEWYFTQEGFPAWGATLVQTLSPTLLGIVYSIVYNGMYMVPEMILTFLAAFALGKIPQITTKLD